MGKIPASCIHLSKRGSSWSREWTRATSLFGYTSAISVANSVEVSGRVMATGRSLALTDTKSATADDKHRSRSLYPVVGCP